MGSKEDGGGVKSEGKVHYIKIMVTKGAEGLRGRGVNVGWGDGKTSRGAEKSASAGTWRLHREDTKGVERPKEGKGKSEEGTHVTKGGEKNTRR